MNWLLASRCSSLYDLYFLAQDTQQIVPGHRVVMAAASPKLAEYLRHRSISSASSSASSASNFNQQCHDLVFPSCSALNFLFEYLYCNRLLPEEMDTLELKSLFDFAVEWEIETLVQILGKHKNGPVPLAQKKKGKFDLSRSCLNFEPLWHDPDFCDVDVVVACGSTTTTIPASRALLAAKSSFFQTMFTFDWSEKQSAKVNVVVSDCLPFGLEEVIHVIDFMYRGTRGRSEVMIGFTPRSMMADGSQIVDCSLMHAAVYFGCDTLQMYCEEALQPHLLTLPYVCDLWIFADSISSETLSDVCLKVVQDNFVAVSETPSFRYLPYHLLHQVLACGRVCCNTMIVFSIVDEWKRNQTSAVQKMSAGLLPPNTLFTREWKHMLLQGMPFPGLVPLVQV